MIGGVGEGGEVVEEKGGEGGEVVEEKGGEVKEVRKGGEGGGQGAWFGLLTFIGVVLFLWGILIHDESEIEAWPIFLLSSGYLIFILLSIRYKKETFSFLNNLKWEIWGPVVFKIVISLLVILGGCVLIERGSKLTGAITLFIGVAQVGVVIMMNMKEMEKIK